MTEEIKQVEEVKEVKQDTSSEKIEEQAKEDQKQDLSSPESEIDAKAREMGWNPDKDGVDDGKWIGAKEYIARAPLFEKNRKLSRKVKELESSVGALKQHYSKIEELAYEKALETLKEKKIKAMDEFDHKTVAQIDEDIIELKKPREKEPQKQAAREIPEFVEWKERNTWYENDKELKAFADMSGRLYVDDNEEASPEQVYRHAEKKVRERYPEKFRNPNRDRPSSVEAGKTQSKQSRPTWSSLPEHFQQAGNKFVRNGIMTKDQYIDDLIKLGELKGA